MDAGVPALGQLYETIRQNLKRRRGRPVLLRLLNRFASQPQSIDGRPPIVEVISLIDACIRGNRPLDSDLTVSSLHRIKQQLVIELARAVTVNKGDRVRLPPSVDLRGRGRKIPGYAKSFARLLQGGQWTRSANRFRFRDAIVTTNWDTTVDVALYEHVYSHTHDKNTDVFLGSSFRDPYDDADAFSDDKWPACLLKLHGSINWLYCPLCARIYVSAFEDNVLRLEGAKNRWERTCDCMYYPLEPVVVAPTAFQEITNPHLSSIWTAAHSLLEDANRWVFIGYSLPGEDLAVRTLLYRAYAARKKKGEHTTVVVIDPKESTDPLFDRFRSLLGSDLKHRRSTFAEFVERGLPR